MDYYRFALAAVADVFLLALRCALLGEDLREAHARLGEALTLSREVRKQGLTLACLESIACVAGGRGEAARAARLLEAAEALREAWGIPRWPHDGAIVEPRLTKARASSEAEAWEAAFAEGGAMTLEKAVTHALEEDTGTQPTVTVWPGE